VKGRRGRRRKQVPDNHKEKRGYWEVKEEALDCTVWRTGFGTGCGDIMRKIVEIREKLWSCHEKDYEDTRKIMELS
jgi:hypothetical protein